MTTLIRRDANGTREWQEVPDASQAEPEAPRPTSRVVRFEVPDGFMATISLVPYTELPGLREALEDAAVWLEAEADHPRPDPYPAMRLQASLIRAALRASSAEPDPA